MQLNKKKDRLRLENQLEQILQYFYNTKNVHTLYKQNILRRMVLSSSEIKM